MLEWIKKSKIVYGVVAIVVATIFNLGVTWATTPRAKDFSVEREARADLERRVSIVEEHEKSSDRDSDDMRAWRIRVEQTLNSIAIRVGAK